MTWRPTGIELASFSEGSSKEVMVGTTAVLLVRSGGAVFAVDAVCPHLGGLLADGFLDGARLTCPEHAAVFDVRSGVVLADPFGIEPPDGGVGPLSVYPTRVESGRVEVDVP